MTSMTSVLSLTRQAAWRSTASSDMSLARAALPGRPAGSPGRDPEPAVDMLDVLASA